MAPQSRAVCRPKNTGGGLCTVSRIRILCSMSAAAMASYAGECAVFLSFSLFHFGTQLDRVLPDACVRLDAFVKNHVCCPFELSLDDDDHLMLVSMCVRRVCSGTTHGHHAESAMSSLQISARTSRRQISSRFVVLASARSISLYSACIRPPAVPAHPMIAGFLRRSSDSYRSNAGGHTWCGVRPTRRLALSHLLLAQVYQTDELKNLDAASADLRKALTKTMKLRSWIYSEAFRDFVRAVTGCGELTSQVRQRLDSLCMCLCVSFLVSFLPPLTHSL